MAATPQHKVYLDGEYVASCKYPLRDGTRSVRLGRHPNRRTGDRMTARTIESASALRNQMKGFRVYTDVGGTDGALIRISHNDAVWLLERMGRCETWDLDDYSMCVSYHE